MIVVDTNVVVVLVTGSASADDAEALFRADPDWTAPVLWRSELRNALLQMVRAGRLSLTDALEATACATELYVAEYSLPDDSVLELAMESGCSAYDCEFVSLAMSLQVPLVTLDRRVANAFPEIARAPFQASGR